MSFSGSHPKSRFGGLEGTWESSLGRGLWGENTGEVGGRTVKSDPLILGGFGRNKRRERGDG